MVEWSVIHHKRQTKICPAMKYSKFNSWGDGPSWQCRKILNLPSLMDTPNRQLTILSAKDLTISEQRLHNKGQRATLRWTGKANMQSCQNPHPRCRDPWSGGISQSGSFFLRNKGFMPTTRHPNPWDLSQEDESPKHPLLKNNGAYIQEAQTTVGKWYTSLKGLTCRLTCLGAQHKAVVWKVPSLFVKEIHLLILKCLPEGQGHVRTLQNGGMVDIISALFLDLISTSRYTQFMHSPTDLLKL